MGKKKCTKCLAVKPTTSFYRHRNATESRCKDCKKSIKKSKYISAKRHSLLEILTNSIDVITESNLSELDSILASLFIIEKSKRSKNDLPKGSEI